MALKKKKRRLTISSIRQARRNSPDIAVPFIRISGVWVNDAGFNIGSQAKVEVYPNVIVIYKGKSPVVHDR